MRLVNEVLWQFTGTVCPARFPQRHGHGWGSGVFRAPASATVLPCGRSCRPFSLNQTGKKLRNFFLAADLFKMLRRQRAKTSESPLLECRQPLPSLFLSHREVNCLINGLKDYLSDAMFEGQTLEARNNLTSLVVMRELTQSWCSHFLVSYIHRKKNHTVLANPFCPQLSTQFRKSSATSCAIYASLSWA